MGNEIARLYPAPTPQIARSLSPQGLEDHRRAIASEVKTVLSAYFQPHEADEIKAAQLAWWCDELQDWTREQVVWGLRQWNRDNPRARPTPGDILSILKAMRGKKEAERIALAAPIPQTDRKPLTADERRAIAVAAGLPDLSAIAKAFPSTGAAE